MRADVPLIGVETHQKVRLYLTFSYVLLEQHRRYRRRPIELDLRPLRVLPTSTSADGGAVDGSGTKLVSTIIGDSVIKISLDTFVGCTTLPKLVV